MEQIFLSRRNLLTLLNKLDRKKNGEQTACSIIKSDNTHPVFSQSYDQVIITAVEDQEYYTEREAGEVLAVDDPSKATE